jgi:hypothetical protein
MKRIFGLSIGALLLAISASGGVVTKRFEWAPQNGVQVLDWTENGITGKQIRFDLGTVVKPTRMSTARAHLRVDNDSYVDVVPGVAVAIFDDQDHLVAAGEGGVWAYDGAYANFTITFARLPQPRTRQVLLRHGGNQEVKRF